MTSRYDSIEPPTTCMIRVFRGGVGYDQRPLTCSVAHSKRVITRLRQKGRKVTFIFFSGMGLGLE